MPAQELPLAERIAPRQEANLLRTLGELYNTIRDLEGSTDGDYVAEFTIPSNVYDRVRYHLLARCEQTGIIMQSYVGGETSDMDTIIWNGIKLTRKNMSGYREQFHFVTTFDIQQGYANTPRIGQYYNGQPIVRVTQSHESDGYEVYTLEPRHRGEVYSDRLVGSWDAPISPAPRVNRPVGGAIGLPLGAVTCRASGRNRDRTATEQTLRAVETIPPQLTRSLWFDEASVINWDAATPNAAEPVAQPVDVPPNPPTD